MSTAENNGNWTVSTYNGTTWNPSLSVTGGQVSVQRRACGQKDETKQTNAECKVASKTDTTNERKKKSKDKHKESEKSRAYI
jgi:hypothetical protein